VALTHMPVPLPAVEAKVPPPIDGEKRRRKPNRVKTQVRAH
jgi:hypothetical protein